MNSIRARILLAIFLFEVAGYGTLMLNNKADTEAALLEVRQRQLEDVFHASTARLDGLTDYMESVARGLAVAGVRFRHQQQAGHDQVAEVQAYLVASLTQLPDAIGGGLWFEPHAFAATDKYFGPYVSWSQGQVAFTWDLNTPTYDYFNQSWYRVAIPAGAGADFHPASSVVWTEPYKDEAGTQALMITVDAFMRDDAGKVIGLATVDWSLDQIQRFLSGVRMTAHSSVFLIDGRSGQVILDTSGATATMTSAQTSWLRAIALDTRPGELQSIPELDVAGTASVVRYAKTHAGLVLGIRVPLDEFGAEATAIAYDGAKVSLVVALVFITLGAIVLHLLFRPFQHVVALIHAATSKRDAQGEMVVEPITYRPRNEFQGIVGALNAMTATIADRDQRLAAHAAQLEQKVADRTAELSARNHEIAARNDEMRLVMNNVNQGLVTIDRDGRLARERSAMIATWFGEVADGAAIWDVIAAHDPRVAEMMRMGLDELFEEIMPAEVTLDQLPRHLRLPGDAGGVELGIAYTPIRTDARLTGVLVLFSDETAVLEAARKEVIDRENVAVFTRLVHDRAGFVGFVREAAALFDALAAPATTLAATKRTLHTLKGNLAMYGVTRIASAIHDLETTLADHDRPPTPDELAAVIELWTEFAGRMQAWLGERKDQLLEIDYAEYRALLRGLVENAPAAELAQRVRAWRLEPAARRLERLADQARRIGERLGREVAVSVDAHGVRLDPEAWSGLWSALVHVVRNAVDHGVEPSDERLAAGKAAGGHLVLGAELRAGALEITVTDDGRGIDWDRVAAKAAARGLPTATTADLTRALFSSGLSTRDEATDLSGRGVGLDALQAAVDELGGTILVESQRGAGTRFVFRFAMDAAPLRRRGPTAGLVVAEVRAA